MLYLLNIPGRKPRHYRGEGAAERVLWAHYRAPGSTIGASGDWTGAELEDILRAGQALAKRNIKGQAKLDGVPAQLAIPILKGD